MDPKDLAKAVERRKLQMNPCLRRSKCSPPKNCDLKA
jgi:hypothetical protein